MSCHVVPIKYFCSVCRKINFMYIFLNSMSKETGKKSIERFCHKNIFNTIFAVCHSLIFFLFQLSVGIRICMQNLPFRLSVLNIIILLFYSSAIYKFIKFPSLFFVAELFSSNAINTMVCEKEREKKLYELKQNAKQRKKLTVSMNVHEIEFNPW